MISSHPEVRAAVANGEQKFQAIGCVQRHISRLPLDKEGWIYTEPSPYNPRGNLRPGEAPPLAVDLTSDGLPQPRLKAVNGVVYVSAYTDLKLHDITSGAGDPNREPLDMNQPPGSPGFFAGDSKFITRKLWGRLRFLPRVPQREASFLMVALMPWSNSTIVSLGHSFLRISSRVTTSPGCSSNILKRRQG